MLSKVLMRNIFENVPTMGVVTLLAKPHSAKHAVMSTKAGSGQKTAGFVEGECLVLE